MFDAEKFLIAYSIPYWAEGKNVSPGWTNIQCPLCYDHSNHGGFSPDGFYNCWKCGAHHTTDIISAVLRCSTAEANRIEWQYTSEFQIKRQRQRLKKKGMSKVCELPAGTADMSIVHRAYLASRGFDSDTLVKEWGVKATTHIGPYKFRIIIPIYVDGKLVSYQGRDVTGRQELRYKTCKIEDESIHHKHIVYGCDRVPGNRCILVEGCTDVWRLGPGAVCSFGTSCTDEQILFMSKRWAHIFVLFDPEDVAADRHVSRIIGELESLGCRADQIELKGYNDPAEMPQDEADEIMKKLKIRR